MTLQTVVKRSVSQTTFHNRLKSVIQFGNCDELEKQKAIPILRDGFLKV